MDFSTGTAVATNHTTADSLDPFAEFYSNYYRADDLGNSLFHYETFLNGSRPHFAPLLDTAFRVADSLDPGYGAVIVPGIGVTGKYCVISNEARIDSNQIGTTDSIFYSFIQAANGTLSVIPGKRSINVPLPPGVIFYTGSSVLTSIPNCDGSIYWIIAYLQNGLFAVLELNSGDTVFVHQTYSVPGMGTCEELASSPTGDKIVTGVANTGSGTGGVYVLSFDKSTGNILSYQYIGMGQHPYNYYNFSEGTRPCFSPNSRFLYLNDLCCDLPFGNTGYLYQLDLYNPNPWATKRTLSQFSRDNALFAPVQHVHPAPDGKLYVGHFYNPGNSAPAYRMGIINFPNVLENGLNSTGYNDNGPDIVPANCPFPSGLLGFGGIADQTDAYGCNWHPNIPNPFNYVATGCLNYRFYADACWTAQWDFGDAASGGSNSSALNAPSHTFSGSGSYAVTLVTNGYTFRDTISITAPAVQIAGTQINPCPAPFASYSIATIQPFVNYTWSVTNGIPATAQGQINLNIQWNAADTTGYIMVVAMDTVMGCVDTGYLNLHYSVNDSVSVNNMSAVFCAGSVYPFGGRNLTTAGIYTDTTVLSGGCKSIIRLDLHIDQPPAVSWAGGLDTFRLHGAGIVLSGGAPAGGSYSGAGVHGNIFYPDSARAALDTIIYTYTDSAGCSGSAYRVFVLSGIADVNLDNQIYLYPNPANNRVVAQSALFTTSGVQMYLYDMTGRLIAIPIERDADKAVFDISALTEGVYFIKFTIGSEEAGKRFVKIE